MQPDLVLGAERPDQTVPVREKALHPLRRFGVDVARVVAVDNFGPDANDAIGLAFGGQGVPDGNVESPPGFGVELLEQRGDGLLGVGLAVGAEEEGEVRAWHRTVLHERRPEEREGVLRGEGGLQIRGEAFGQGTEPRPERPVRQVRRGH